MEVPRLSSKYSIRVNRIQVKGYALRLRCFLFVGLRRTEWNNATPLRTGRFHLMQPQRRRVDMGGLL